MKKEINFFVTEILDCFKKKRLRISRQVRFQKIRYFNIQRFFPEEMNLRMDFSLFVETICYF